MTTNTTAITIEMVENATKDGEKGLIEMAVSLGLAKTKTEARRQSVGNLRTQVRAEVVRLNVQPARRAAEPEVAPQVSTPAAPAPLPVTAPVPLLGVASVNTPRRFPHGATDRRGVLKAQAAKRARNRRRHRNASRPRSSILPGAYVDQRPLISEPIATFLKRPIRERDTVPVRNTPAFVPGTQGFSQREMES